MPAFSSVVAFVLAALSPASIFGLIVASTGLSLAQVARGMAELRGGGVIEPVEVEGPDGRLRPDRPSFGHVAQFRLAVVDEIGFTEA